MSNETEPGETYRSVVLPFWQAGALVELEGEKSDIRELIKSTFYMGAHMDHIIEELEREAPDHNVEVEFWHGESPLQKKRKEAKERDARNQYADEVKEPTMPEEEYEQEVHGSADD